MADKFIQERNEAVISAFKGDYTKLYSYIAKWNGVEFYNGFKSATDEAKRMTVCKMVCAIISEEMTPYKHEAEQWLREHGASPTIGGV